MKLVWSPLALSRVEEIVEYIGRDRPGGGTGLGESLRRLLGSEPEPAIATLVEAIEAIDPDLIDELSRQVAARRRSRRGS